MATGADYEVVDVSSGEEITNPGANDVMVAFHKSTGALEKIDYNKLAKAIIEQYTGSTIGGAAQSVKAAVDIVSNATTVKNMPSSADFNNYTETGVWRCDLLETSVTNGPPVGTYVSGFLFVSKYNSNAIIQRFCFSGSSKDELIRFKWNGTWSAWVKQPTRDEMNAKVSGARQSLGKILTFDCPTNGRFLVLAGNTGVYTGINYSDNLAFNNLIQSSDNITATASRSGETSITVTTSASANITVFYI